jgi:hypothetical protein
MTLLPAMFNISFSHLCGGRFVDNSLGGETIFQVVSNCAVVREVWLILPRCFLHLVSVFRRALLIGANWSPGCFTSSNPTSDFGMRWIIFVSCTDRIPLSLPREARPTPSWWPSTSEGACGSAFTARWAPLSRSAGELVRGIL